MPDFDALPFPIGTYITMSDSTFEGREFRVPDLAYTGTPGVVTGRSGWSSGTTKVVRIVRNNSGIALLPGRLVAYQLAKYGNQVDGYTTTTAAPAAGVVDEYLPSAGVPDQKLFYIVVEGLTSVLTSLGGNAENVFSAGSLLVAITAATSQATTAGRVIAVDSQTDTNNSTGTKLYNQAVNRLGVALTASTTANTNASKLMYLRRQP